MAKANYHQIRRQKELARKTRQQEKQQKRAAAKASEEPVAAHSDVAVPAVESVNNVGESSGDNEVS